MVGSTLPSIAGSGPLSGASGSGDATSIQGRPVDSAAPLTTEVLVWDGAKWTPEPVDATLLHGYLVGATAPSPGDVLTWGGAQWAPAAAAGGLSRDDIIQLIMAYGG